MLAFVVVAIELAAISWIRTRYMDTPFLQAAFQVVVGGVLVFACRHPDRQLLTEPREACSPAKTVVTAHDSRSIMRRCSFSRICPICTWRCTPRLPELAGKRGLGFINWQRGRKYIHRRETLDAITRDLKAAAADHIAVTGDLVNLSLPIEYAAARAWLDTLGPPHDVTVIPGNHDAYVPQALGGPEKFWGDYMRGDDGAPSRHLSVRAPARTASR